MSPFDPPPVQISPGLGVRLGETGHRCCKNYMKMMFQGLWAAIRETLRVLRAVGAKRSHGTPTPLTLLLDEEGTPETFRVTINLRNKIKKPAHFILYKNIFSSHELTCAQLL